MFNFFIFSYFRRKNSSEDEIQAKTTNQFSKSFRMQKFKFPKYYKSKSYDKDYYEEQKELETPLSSSKLDQDSNIHENHKLCKDNFIKYSQF